jgi:hypothetical protein
MAERGVLLIEVHDLTATGVECVEDDVQRHVVIVFALAPLATASVDHLVHSD